MEKYIIRQFILHTQMDFHMNEIWEMTPPTITTPARYYGRVGDNISRLAGSAGTGFSPASTWSLVSGTLPTGVTGLNPDGTFTGIPTTTGTWTITVRHGNANPAGGAYNINFHADQVVTIVITPAPSATATPPPIATPLPQIPGAVVATYTYRADGLRVSKTVNGVRTTHVWLRGSIILERNTSGAVINRFIRSRNGQLIMSQHHGWYVLNARGDVVQRVGNNGGILRAYRYSAFGNEFTPDISNTNPWRFAGEYWDWETGTYYLRARNFNPRTGRFTQPDPFWNNRNMQRSGAAILQSGNLFMFTMHNPVMFTDPSGMVATIPRLMDTLSMLRTMTQSVINQVRTTASQPRLDFNTIDDCSSHVGGVTRTITRPTDSSIVTSGVNAQGILMHNVTTTIRTRLRGSATFEWWIDDGQIQIDFNDNSLWGVLLRGYSTTLAEEMLNVTRSINPYYLSGRTLGGIRTDVQLHWAGYAIDQAAGFIEFERWDFIARIGGLYSDMPGFDDNAWFFEGAYAASIAARFNPFMLPWGAASAGRDLGREFMNYLSFRRN